MVAVYGHISRHSHRKLYFKGAKSFTETLDVSKTKIKYFYFAFIFKHLML